MFLRVVRAAGGKGVKHEYVRVVEAFRENGPLGTRTPGLSSASRSARPRTSSRAKLSAWSKTPSGMVEEDTRLRELTDTRNELDSAAYQVDRVLAKRGDTLPVHEKARAENVVAEARQALKEQGPLDRSGRRDSALVYFVNWPFINASTIFRKSL